MCILPAVQRKMLNCSLISLRPFCNPPVKQRFIDIAPGRFISASLHVIPKLKSSLPDAVHQRVSGHAHSFCSKSFCGFCSGQCLNHKILLAFSLWRLYTALKGIVVWCLNPYPRRAANTAGDFLHIFWVRTGHQLLQFHQMNARVMCRPIKNQFLQLGASSL